MNGSKWTPLVHKWEGKSTLMHVSVKKDTSFIKIGQGIQNYNWEKNASILVIFFIIF